MRASTWILTALCAVNTVSASPQLTGRDLDSRNLPSVGDAFSALFRRDVTNCPRGQQPGKTKCSPCTSNKVSTGNEPCKSCPTGWIPTLDRGECEKCNENMYAAVGAGACSTCNAGKVPNEARSGCTNCPAGNIAAAGDLTCTPCPAGEYQSSTGQSKCNSCKAGTFSTAGSKSCTDCEANTFSSSDKATECTKCEAGTQSTLAKKSKSCKDCAKGETSIAGGPCTKCPAGTFAATAKSPSCDKCPENQISATVGSTACSPCAPGTEANEAQNACVPCKAGFFGDGLTKCKACDAGSISSAGSTTCTPCGNGKIPNKDDASKCDTCDGSLIAAAGATECTACEAGQAPNADKGGCTKCTAGLQSDGTKACDVCPKGYAPREDGKGCTQCAEFTFSDGTKACAPCGLGQTASSDRGSCESCPTTEVSDGTKACAPCKKNEQPRLDRSTCDTCQTGEVSDGTKACSTCKAGEKPSADNSVCDQCPSATPVSNGIVCSSCAPGQKPKEDKTDCESCPEGNASDGLTCTACKAGEQVSGDKKTCEDCLPGQFSTGTECKFCAPGKQPSINKDTCEECPAGQFSTAAGICLPCAAGTFSAKGATECTPCGLGEVSAEGSEVCTPCGSGKFPKDASNCDNCAIGSVNNGAAVCTPCLAGEKPDAEKKACVPCPGGSSSLVGAADCEACAKDTFAVAGAACLPCEFRKFSAAGAESCFECPPGQVPEENRAGCKSCDGPNEFVKPDGSACEACPPETPRLVAGICKPALPDCGEHATVDLVTETCVCKAPGATFKSDDKSCGCGEGATLTGDVCVCNAPTDSIWTQDTNSGAYSCICSGDKPRLDGTVCKPARPECGDHATVDDASNLCVCKAPGATFKTEDKSCSCGEGASLVGDACVCNLPTESIWTQDTNSGAYSCVCSGDKPRLDGTVCKPGRPDCGEHATVDDASNTCVCKAPGATFKAEDKSCGCGEGATLVGDACVCSAPTDSVWTKTDGAETYSCACVGDKPRLDGTTCKAARPECGDNATVDEATNACVCKAPGATFKTEDKSCGCGEGATLNANGQTCDCTAPTDSAWTLDANTNTYSCACGGEKPRLDNGVCKPGRPDCGEHATVDEASNTCVCKAPGATFKAEDKSCSCGEGATLNGDVCQCSAPTDSVWTKKDDTFSCACPADKPRLDNGVCKPAIPDCGSSATLDAEKNICVCKAPGATFKSEDKSCVCGEGATLTGDECKCSAPAKSLWAKDNSGKYSCKCAIGQVLSADKKTCNGKPSCGSTATYDAATNSCICKAPGATFDENETCACPEGSKLASNGKTCQCDLKGGVFAKGADDKFACSCPVGKVPKDGACVTPVDCGSNAVLGEDGKTCVCKAEGATFNKAQKTCGCGSSATLNQTGDKCECAKPINALWVKNDSNKYVCQCAEGQKNIKGTCAVPPPDCGSKATVDTATNTCVCKAPGATFSASDRSCECGPDARLSGNACVCNTSGAVWAKGADDKFACACPAGQKKDNNKCILDCGSEAKYNGGTKTCKCNNPNFEFNAATGKCDCTEAADIDASGKNCKCKVEGALWGAISHTCVCPSLMTNVNNKCQKPTRK